MDLYSIVEGPLLWTVFLVFFAGLLSRFSSFLCSLIIGTRDKEKRPALIASILARFLFPFHKAFAGKPLYSAPRYVFHICLFVVPVWLSGHIVLWSESRFEWDWMALPDAWADGMTLLLLAIAAFLLLRRLISAEIRKASSPLDIVLILVTAFPFMTGYFLAHGTLASIPFLADHMATIHMACGEAMILMALFLFYRPLLDTRRCTGCASCVQSCPTETLEADDQGGLRVFRYAHFQCICCGSCVKVCPEGAAELRHELSAKRLVQVFSKREIRTVELEVCRSCGAFFAPELQMKKIALTLSHDYIHFCPSCRKTGMGNLFRRRSPRLKSP
jgi:NAD-dependent dihydropyrimidine dehydrogenase PreA subunit